MKRRKLSTRALRWLAFLALLYLGVAYLAAPEIWTFRDREIAVSPAQMVTRTPDGIAGDPINVGLVSTRSQVIQAFGKAGWDTADAITLKSAIEIGASVLFDRPYPDAPVSTLLYDNHKQDLAFEKPVGASADQRHHVRLWMTADRGKDGRPLWLGSASFDRGVGVSHDTGQITHHIAPDLDAERDGLIADLRTAGEIAETTEIEGIGATKDGRNGGGDPYFTDGKALVGVLINSSN